MKILPPISIEGRRLLPGKWDMLAAVLVLGFLILFADVSRDLVQPLANVAGQDLSLDPANLPGYAARTALRMLIAMGVSLAFTFASKLRICSPSKRLASNPSKIVSAASIPERIAVWIPFNFCELRKLAVSPIIRNPSPW